MDRDLFLVTGAAGFIGGQVAELLIREGKRVRILVRKPEQAERLKNIQGGDRVEVAVGDLCDPESLTRAVEGVGGVYHIAALYRQAGLPETAFFDVNVTGTKNLFEASIAAGVERIVHCSTGGVLGHIAKPPAKETDPYNPGDMYQRSKMEGEKLVLDYFRSGRIRGAVIRPAMVYGPGDTRHLKMFKMIAKGMFFYVGRGDAWVNFIDVRDLARSFKLAMEHEEVNAEVYHIAGRRAVKLHEAVAMIAREFNVGAPKLHLPVKPMQWAGSLCEAVCAPFGINPPIFKRRVDFFTKSRYFDWSKAREQIGFEPAQDLEAEIRDAVGWYRSHGWV